MPFELREKGVWRFIGRHRRRLDEVSRYWTFSIKTFYSHACYASALEQYWTVVSDAL